ncbi:hypothetical protein CDN99_04815 [Roseateles aquatilis]|uniref:DUF1640 domain-containing protein n=1 Tax=Roseateles aquatilis TaxID=431061 RepID=A0A246JMJ1_9BURK|nr:hypothetical protein [Roseateles aquatilis]OWQ93770.1 hypothetical protein CDN99_04815 [Roseateles aquatilis]
MSTWHKVRRLTKAGPRRRGRRSGDDVLTRAEHDAKNDALLQQMRAEWAMLRSDLATFRGDMVERLGKVEGEITGIKGQIDGIKGQIDGLKGEVEGLRHSLTSTQWLVASALGLLALFSQVPSIISAYRFPPAGSAASARSAAPTVSRILAAGAIETAAGPVHRDGVAQAPEGRCDNPAP